MTILVTGATGFLGQAILPLLAQRGEVVALHRPGSAPPDGNGVRWIGQDLDEPAQRRAARPDRRGVSPGAVAALP